MMMMMMMMMMLMTMTTTTTMICLCASAHPLCRRNMSALLFASFSPPLLQATFHYTGK
jgi:hypothetical protein